MDEVIAQMIDNKKSKKQLIEEIKQLRQYADGLKNVLQGTNIGTWEWNVQTGEITCNERWAQIVGYTLDELKPAGNKTWEALVHPEDKKKSNELLDRHFSGELDYFDIECRLKHKEGQWVWVHDRGQIISWTDDGKPLIMCGSHTDITKRKKIEESLLESEVKLRAILDASPDVINLLDVNGIILSSNKGFAKRFGLDIDDVIGKSVFDFGLPESIDERKAALDKVIKTGEPLQFVTKGLNSLFESYIQPIFDSAGRVTAVAVYAQDITKRKQAEEALRESEEKYRLLVDNTDTGFVVVDEKGIVIEANEPYLRLVGVEHENKIVGHSITEWTAPECKEENIAAVALCSKQGFIKDFETTYIRNDGTRVIILVNAIMHETLEGKRLYAQCFDITVRKNVERTLRESEDKLLEAQRIAHLGYYSLEIKADCWTSSNELDKIFGIDDSYKKDLFCWLHIVHPDYREAMSKYFQDEVLSQNQKFDKEYKIVDATTGQEKWVHGLGSLKFDENGNPFEMFGTIQDITERKQAEETLFKSEQMLSDVLNTIPARVFWKNLDGVFLGCNQLFAKDAGKDNPAEVIGDNDYNMSWVEQAELYRRDDRNVIESGQPKINYEEPQTTPAGKTIWLNTSKIPLHNSKGIVYGVLGTYEDITERKRLQALESRAERLKMAGTIAGQVAHDFNNLLAPLMGYPELIREELAHDSKAHAYLDTIELAAKKIAYINQDLLTMGRRGHYNQQVLDLNRVVLQSVQEMESRTKTVTCEMKLCEDIMKIKGGDAQIHRALTNLLVNAQDAMQDIGQIRIKTENYYANDTSIAFGCVPKGEYVKLTISDNGCGIPDDIIQKILDPFFSTKTTDKKRGSGLGLSVVDAVMKDHNGYLDMSSKIGHGTSFYLYFPVTRENVGEDEIVQLIGGQESILVVDDDDIQREVSLQLLTNLGYKVASVESGEKAIEFLKENPQDLIILDMVMSDGIDGAETYRQILELSPQQRAIILSGFSGSDRVQEAQKLGAGAFIRKPVTKSVIAAAVRTELDRQVKLVTSQNC